MTDNLSLWHQVEKTPIEQTKPITGKSYSGTSPKPHYLVQKATETFGPCGIGWGFTVDERIEQGAMYDSGDFERMHIAKVKVWYKWDGERGEVEHIGGTPFSGRRKNGTPYTDEDAPKKSVTDALVKALSMIGFAGDIFMGRYDDSKYISDLRDEEKQSKAPANDRPKPISAAEQKRGLADIDNDLLDCHSEADVRKCAAIWKSIAETDGWSRDYQLEAKSKFDAKRIELAESATNDDRFPGDTDIKDQSGRRMHTMEG